jgi:hypothetical protein
MWFNWQTKQPVKFGFFHPKDNSFTLPKPIEDTLEMLSRQLMRKKRKPAHQIISTEAHGMLDYMTVGTFLLLPRLLGWNAGLTRLMTGAAAFTFLYSLMTRYEFGLVKVLPMKTHLMIDGMSGLFFVAAPAMMPDEDSSATLMMAGLGAMELAAALLSEQEVED